MALKILFSRMIGLPRIASRNDVRGLARHGNNTIRSGYRKLLKVVNKFNYFYLNPEKNLKSDGKTKTIYSY